MDFNFINQNDIKRTSFLFITIIKLENCDRDLHCTTMDLYFFIYLIKNVIRVCLQL